MNSKLFVPASRPALFAKALQSEAHALSFDLEDAVAPAAKPQARIDLQDFLARLPPTPALTKTLIVRVNAVDSPYFEEDIAAMARPGVALINLPKPGSVEEVLYAVERLAAAEQANELRQQIGLLLNIETPKALRIAYALGSAHERVRGLQLGLGDMFEPNGIARYEATAVQQAMFAMRLAAAEAEVFAFDAAFADIADEAGFLAEAGLAKRLGYIGKSCIHPRQVALANSAFRPSEAERAHAQKVVAAAEAAGADGPGTFVVDGKMIDAPFLARARQILAQAA